MKEKERIGRILDKIKILWNRNPDQRLFQLLFNYTLLGTRTELGSVKDPFYYEDDETEQLLNDWIVFIEEENGG